MRISATPGKTRPGYRFANVLAAAALMAGTGFSTTSAARADSEPVLQTLDPRPTTGVRWARPVVTDDQARKLPNARKTDRTSFKLGKAGPAFESEVSARIIGGQPANVADHPYVVGIQTLFLVAVDGGRFEGYVSTCTGTVLSPTKVLTAGRCSFGSQLGTTYVIAGRNDLGSDGSGFVTVVRSTFTHQGYSEDSGGIPNNDVAVLTLRDPLPAAYTPIALGDQGDESVYTDNTPARVVGYGLDSFGTLGVLNQATVPIRADGNCAGNPDLAGYVSATMVCAGSPGVDTCGGDSGSPMVVTTTDGVETEVGIASWGPLECGSSFGVYAQVSTYSNLIMAEVPRTSPNNLDWTGDGHSDLMGRTASGEVLIYSGSGLVNGQFTSAFTPDSKVISNGWSGLRKIFRVFDWNDDRKPSVFRVDGSGNLWQDKGTGQGEFDPAGTVQIGNGWSGFSDIMITSNWTGNGRPNLLGRQPDGDLLLYTSNGVGGWENSGVGIPIGTGWSMFDTVLTPGDWLGDGRQTLIGRQPNGNLLLYQSDGAGGWMNGGVGVMIGTGWNAFSIVMSPGDFNGDSLVDMIGITPGGEMRLYKSDGRGNWLNGGLGITIASGWDDFNAVF